MVRHLAILGILVLLTGCGQSGSSSPAYRGLTPVSDADAGQRAIELCQRMESLTGAKVLHTRPVFANSDYTEVLVEGTIAGQPAERVLWIHKFNGKGDRIK